MGAGKETLIPIQLHNLRTLITTSFSVIYCNNIIQTVSKANLQQLMNITRFFLTKMDLQDRVLHFVKLIVTELNWILQGAEHFHWIVVFARDRASCP